VENNQEPSAPAQAGSISTGTLRGLNLLGDLAHVAVAALLILVTVLVLMYACLAYIKQIILIAPILHQNPTLPTAGSRPADVFILSSVEFLSNILFAVILLEVLHTTLTFLHDRSSRAIVRAFLVVAILSIVRKILLVGAESSLTSEMGMSFIYSAAGTLVSIAGILLLVWGLIYVGRMEDEPA
jgi:uncharacterized membrane protein (DUF373 family)